MPAQVYLQIVISPTKIHYLTSTQNLFQSGFLACLFYCIFTNSYFFRSWWLFLRIQHGCQTGFVWVFWRTKSTKVEEIITNFFLVSFTQEGCEEPDILLRNSSATALYSETIRWMISNNKERLIETGYSATLTFLLCKAPTYFHFTGSSHGRKITLFGKE